MKVEMKVRRYGFALVAATLCALLLISAPASDSKRRDTSRLPFNPPEELIYNGEFSKAILRGVDIAELKFTANRAPLPLSNTTAGTSDALQFVIDAESKGVLRKLFRIDFHQHIESTVEPQTFSVLRTTKLDEQGKRKRTSEAVFDQSAGKVVWTERDPNDPAREPRVVTNETSGTVQDIASAFYYLRTQPLEVGRSFELLISDSGQVYHIPIAVTERKKMKTVIGEVQTLKVEPDIFGEGRLLRGKGKLTLWLTDDARHIPVRAKINNEMGTLDVTLKRMTGNGVPELH